MPATTKVPLGPATLARKWYMDVNTGTHAAPNWIGVFGITDFHPLKSPTLKDDSDYDSGAYKSQTVTALASQLTLTVDRKVQNAVATAYDPGQEALRAISDLTGIGNRAEIRWYEMPDSGPRVEAYQAYFAVSWVPNGGDMDALDTVTITLDGKGARIAIPHPDTVVAVPTITALSPITGGIAGGTLVQLVGTGFTGLVATSGVKFGATNASTWWVESDNVVYAVAPSHVAGAVNVIATNATGPSISTATFTYS